MITVNQKTLEYLSDGNNLYREMLDYLNGVIEKEFEKEDINCDLIDECVNAVGELQKELENKTSSDSVNKKRIKLTPKTRAVIAAALAVVIGLNVLYHASPAFADSVNGLFSSILSALRVGANETQGLEDLSSIYAVAPDGNKIKVTSEADIDEKDFIVFAVYRDGTKNEVPVKDCKIEKTVALEDGTKYLLINISYGGCSCAVAYEMEGI